MNTVYILIDHPNSDYLLVPVIEEICKRALMDTIVCVYGNGSSDLLKEKNIAFTTDINSVNHFVQAKGLKLFLNSADTDYLPHYLGKSLDKFFREKHIPSLTLEHVAVSMYSDALEPEACFNADRIALFGGHSFSSFKNIIDNEDRLVITGSPKYDDPLYQLKDIKHKCIETTIFFAGVIPRFRQFGARDDEITQILIDLFQSIFKHFPSAHLTIKPHPAEPETGTISFYEEALKTESFTQANIISAHANIAQYIVNSDFVITFSPSVLLESYILGTHGIFLTGPLDQPKAMVDLKKEGALILKSEWNEMGEVLDQSLLSFRDEMKQRVRLSEKFISNYLYRLDGKASERVVYLIDQMMKNANISLDKGILLKWCEKNKLEQVSEKKEVPIENSFMENPEDESYAIAYHKLCMATEVSNKGRSQFKDAVLRYPDNKRLHHLYISLLLKQEDYHEAMVVVEDFFLRFGIDSEMLDPALSIREKIGPFDRMSKANDCSHNISLCMIVKDEMQHLMDALSSVKLAAHEMIVVDTGSKDFTPIIARIFGAKLFEFPWTGNFSDARNYAMEKSKGDWILSLDADEVISIKDHSKFQYLIENHSGGLAAFTFTTRNYSRRVNVMDWEANDGSYPEEAGLGWYPSEKVRLFPNMPEFKFEFPIHEKVEPSLRRCHVSIYPSNIIIHHYGPLNEGTLTKKAEEYLGLGRLKLNVLNNDVPSLRELAVQAGNLERWEEAISLWHKLIQLKPNIPEFYLNLGTALWHMGKYDQALENAEKVLSLDSSCVEGFFNSGMSCLFMGKVEMSIDFFRKTLEEKENYLPAQLMLSIALGCLGEMEKATIILDQLNQSGLQKVLPISLKDVINRFNASDLTHFTTCVENLAFHCNIVIPDKIRI